MKHIRTPVEIDGILGILDAGKRPICEVWVIGGAEARAIEAEIAAALNQHDALIAQRDALREACRVVGRLLPRLRPSVPLGLLTEVLEAEALIAAVEAGNA